MPEFVGQVFDRFLEVHGTGIKGYVRLRIHRGSFIENQLQVFKGLTAPRHGSHVPLSNHPVEVILGLGLQPNGEALSQQ